VRGPGSDDICYATTNRQIAIREVAAQSDLVLVVGSKNSSNSVRMVELAARNGTPAHLVDDASEIDPAWLAGVSRVGLSAGASAPPELVDEVVAALRALGPVSVSTHTTATETISFTLPPAVRSAG
jgi:4-hydroxy-3-methylbut-2-enyl diphosphate reductase